MNMSASEPPSASHRARRGLLRRTLGGGAAAVAGIFLLQALPPLFGRSRMPSFSEGIEWLNTEPGGPAELRGHVVLVDFWTFTCINWLRTAPYVRAWAQAYRSDGLIVLGVHTPEFSFEHRTDLIRLATREHRIDYPVAVDNDYKIWNAFDNRYWPALYFVDGEGTIRDHHFGEGDYEQSERTLQRMLGVRRELVSVEGTGVEAEADWSNLRSPETYLTYGSDSFASAGDAPLEQSGAYSFPDRLPLNNWAVDGEWTIGNEKATLRRAGGRLAFRYHARDAHLVLSSQRSEPISFRVALDGEAPGLSHGVDIDEEGNGSLRDGRLYQLVRAHDAVRERTLEITFLEPGVEAYAFTFG
jgi:thiol-disulfide isomerase/thioredoxin